MIESMKVRYGYINPNVEGGEYLSGTTLLPTEPNKYGDLMEIGLLPYMIPNSNSLDEMLDDIEKGDVVISWDSDGEGVFGIFKAEVVYSETTLELRIYRMFLNT